MSKKTTPINKLVVFQSKKIRRIIHKDEWWFSVVDVISALTDSNNPQVYWRVMKKRLKDEGADETVTNCNGLKMTAPDGKKRLTVGCAQIPLGEIPPSGELSIPSGVDGYTWCLEQAGILYRGNVPSCSPCELLSTLCRYRSTSFLPRSRNASNKDACLYRVNQKRFPCGNYARIDCVVLNK